MPPDTSSRHRASRPAISVIVPFYDSAAHIEQCFDSLLEQRGLQGTYEILFIDNGSRDGARQILEQASARHGAGGAGGAVAAIHILHEAEPGAYAARNLGIAHAAAPICAFTDADCRVEPSWLAAVQHALAAPRVAAAVGRCSYQRHASAALRLLGAYENQKTELVLARYPPAYRFVYANNLAIQTAVLAELGGFRTWRRAGDTELVHRLARQRPELEVRYEPRMQVTHLEFLRARDRLQRLRVYTTTNAKIEGFRELDAWQRLQVLLYLLRAVLPGGAGSRRGEPT